jgi:hypothetical protein
MTAFGSVKKFIKTTPLAIPYIAVARALRKGRGSQSDEEVILDRLLATIGAVPKVFIEFGFSGWEFNCVRLAEDRSWQGLLLDGDRYNITVAKTIYHRDIEARHLWITLETLQQVVDFARGREVGVLSVDVDGNDYWFLQRLIGIRPAIVCVEINVFMGLRPIAVPYDPEFERTKKHKSWAYFGASLSAMHHLCRRHGYSLVAMSASGVNAFFVRDDLLTSVLRPLTPAEAYREQIEPDGRVVPTATYWEQIMDMPFVDVTQ